MLKIGNIIYADYCHTNVGKATDQRNVICIMRRRRERQKKRARERWRGKEKGVGGERMEGKKIPPFIVLEYGNLHSQVCGFLHYIFPDDYEKPIIASLN